MHLRELSLFSMLGGNEQQSPTWAMSESKTGHIATAMRTVLLYNNSPSPDRNGPAMQHFDKQLIAHICEYRTDDKPYRLHDTTQWVRTKRAILPGYAILKANGITRDPIHVKYVIGATSYDAPTPRSMPVHYRTTHIPTVKLSLSELGLYVWVSQWAFWRWLLYW